ncbi:hypothetical protein CR513_12347, partial [Mucuna pruriens]
MLVFPNRSELFIAYNDAFKMILSGVLMLKDLELNMRQCKRLEFLKDYNFDHSHHPSKAIVVVNALSRTPSYVYD